MKQLLLITTLLLTLVNTCLATTANKKIIVIDAGSLHSTLYVYEYTPAVILPSSVKTIYQKTINPGLSTVPTDEATLNNYFYQLFSEVDSIYHKPIPTYFYATGGMRLLPAEKQQVYFTAVNNWVKSHTQFQLKENRTLPGQWEGIYSWVTINYLLHNFDNQHASAGILDLGGASTQITYEMTDKVTADSIDLNIANHHYNLYSKSYLGLGQDQARNQFTDDTNCYSVDYPLSNGKKAQGNFSQCQLEVNALINDIHHVNQQNMTLPEKMSFYLVSGYFYEATAKPIDLLANYTIGGLINKGTTFCNQSWDISKQLYPKEKYLYWTCFNAAYQATLLHEGYGFDLTRSLIPINQIDNNEIGWALGAMLVHAKTH